MSDILELEKKYGNFYAPAFEIWIDNQDIVKQLNIEIVSVSVDNTLDGADTFTFTVNNAFDIINREVLWFDNLFKLGKQVEIKMGYANSANKLTSMIIGLITSTKINFPSEGVPQMEVSGFDLSFKLMKNKETRNYKDLKDSDIAEDIASKYNLRNSKEDPLDPLDPIIPLTNVRDDSGIKYQQTVKQETESDFEFLRKLADRNYFEFFVFRNTLYFRMPTVEDEPIVTLEWGKSLISFSPENSFSEYVIEVQVKGRNTNQNKDIESHSTSQLREEQKESGNFTTIEFKTEVVNATVDTTEEAQRLAESKLKKLNEGYLKGSGESIGIPEILAGTNIKLDGLGSQLSKKYYIEKTNHSISSSGYRTTFNVKDMSEIINLGTESTVSERDSTTSEPEENGQ